MINFGWGLAVFAGVFVAYASGAHLNPAVTVGLWVNRRCPRVRSGHSQDLHRGPHVPGRADDRCLHRCRRSCWLAYKQHFDAEPDAGQQARRLLHRPGHPLLRLEPRHRDHRHLRAGLRRSSAPAATGAGGLAASAPLPVALLVVGIGASLGGPTGYAINPARDLGPRIAHAILPIKGKGASDWAYSWVPVVGPLIGGVLAGLAPRSCSDPRCSRGCVASDHSSPRRAPDAWGTELATSTSPKLKGVHHMAKYVLAIDQGTTSTRAIIFDHAGTDRLDRPDGARADLPAGRAGSSTTPTEIWDNAREVIGQRPGQGRT